MEAPRPHPVEAMLNYRFADQDLLRTALTHSSYVNESVSGAGADNERMEYLGDAVLDFIVADWLFREYPELTEGEMTNLRALLVREETLAHLARAISLGECLLLGKGEDESGGRGRAHNLCAGFEALIGAAYLDGGMEPIRGWLLPMMRPELHRALRDQSVRDPKSLLQEWAQGRYHLTPAYETVAEEGPDHAKQFSVQVVVNGQVLGQGKGRSKQSAAQDAARAALRAVEVKSSTT